MKSVMLLSMLPIGGYYHLTIIYISPLFFGKKGQVDNVSPDGGIILSRGKNPSQKRVCPPTWGSKGSSQFSK
jgi:hypothetical protein